MNVRVFDPAMCCSTGICGPSVDPKLVRFAADLDWLASSGASVERYNLSQQPAAFVEHAAVKKALEAQGDAALPVVMVDDQVKSTGTYPSREQLAEWAGVAKPAPSLFTEAVSELVAIGAAIASNCEPCFKFHYDKARKLGVPKEDMLRAVTVAQSVKESPARTVLETAHRYLREAEGAPAAAPASKLEVLEPASAACCEPKSAEPGKKKCC